MEHLDIVDENDEVISRELRSVVHKKGLLHREINVFIFNDANEVMLQKRSLTKETFPGLWDASAGGHVDAGMTYDQAAVIELEEECGVKVNAKDLVFITKKKTKSIDDITHTINYKFKSIYILKVDKQQRFKLEEGKATELRFWKIDELLRLPESERIKFTFLLNNENHNLFKEIAEIINRQK